ncbi:MFS transporter [Variovorax boronicumulans]|uniref:MFS transporter n=1 Tax=Variovorax boronicumulans TaxID=436515 RepID=UPI001C579E2B
MNTTHPLQTLSPPLPDAADPDASRRLFRRLDWRMLPLLMVCYMVAYIDRVNLGYAQLQMKQTLPFGDEVYGLGAGIFFIGYFLFEVPSSMLLKRIGARATLLRIMFCWGLVAAGMMFVQTPTQFYTLRFLLGVFEAGFLPGVVYYLTQWYPSARRGQVVAIFMAAAVAAGVLAGPMSGFIMKHFDGVHGWTGWQWLFLLQGLPASVLGVVVWFCLHDSPEQAPWLSAEEKALLRRELATDPAVASAGHGSMRALLKDPRVYALALVDFLLIGANYALVFWMPTLIKGWGVTDLVQIGLYAAVPQVLGVIGMILIGRSSDRRGERRWHYAASSFLAALGLWITIQAQSHLALSMLGLCIAVIGLAAATPLFITVVTEYLAKPVAATGIAFINSLAILGGAVSPPVIGMINARAGNPVPAIYFVLTLYVLSGLLMLAVVRRRR